MTLSTSYLLLTSITFLPIIFANLQFCYRGKHQLKILPSQKDSLHCPYGLLFKQPVIIGAVELTDLSEQNSEFCFGKSICDSAESWTCSEKLQYAEAQLIVPYKALQNRTEKFSGDKFVSQNVPLCTSQKVSDNEDDYMNSVGMKRRRKKRQVEEDPAKFTENKHPIIEDKRIYSDAAIQSQIDEQTKRMFYYITNVNIEDVSSHLRVTKLFHNSVRLVHMICDPLYLKEEFLGNVEKGFMYLLKQQGLERITDVDVDDFAMLLRALEYCMGDPDSTVFIEGNHCPADFYVEAIRRNEDQLPYDRTDEANYVWGKYDIAVDAAWHIIDIVHGMCFSTLRENLNLHHKYQVVMEQLFHDNIHLRWHSPTQLMKEDRVDNVFTVSVNSSMEVLDACAQGAYISAPFLHRLQRPDVHGESGTKRRKRSLEQGFEEISENNLEGITYCLQSPEDLLQKTNKMREKQC